MRITARSLLFLSALMMGVSGCSMKPAASGTVSKPSSPPPEQQAIAPVSETIAEVEMTTNDQPPADAAPVSLEPSPLLRRFLKGRPLPGATYDLVEPGDAPAIDYEQYGTFTGVGTTDYFYEITNLPGLQAATGEAVYPNDSSIYDNPLYRKLMTSDQLDIGHWEALSSEVPGVPVFVWADAHESGSTKAYFTAVALEKSGHIEQAIKAYHAVLLHYPAEACWSAEGTFVWYIAPAALASIQRLCREYPALDIELQDAEISIQNSGDTDLDNDIVRVNPGRIVSLKGVSAEDRLPNMNEQEIVEQRGTGLVQVVRFANGHWQLRVDGKPMMVRGVSYGPTEIGYSPENDAIFGHRWMITDKNNNGKVDAAYDAWVDANANGVQDDNEPSVGDFQLLKDMGCNAIRKYLPNAGPDSFDPKLLDLDLLRDLYERFGIRVIAGDFLGAYTVGSGASWKAGTDYTNPEQRARMKKIVREKVLALRDEPWLLMWVLGNENNMGGDHTGINATRTNASSKPEAYASFLNEVAEMIHELDPNHPVAVGNLEAGMLDVYAKHAPALDIMGINSYRGGSGFGSLFDDAGNQFDRPVLITEYGCDAYWEGRGPDEEAQRSYHENGLRDIVLNQAGGPMSGRCIGGIAFEYLDEWWKAGDPKTHAITSQWGGPMPDRRMHEEWLGLVGQGSGNNSPFERRTRKVYDFYKTVWNLNETE